MKAGIKAEDDAISDFFMGETAAGVDISSSQAFVEHYHTHTYAFTAKKKVKKTMNTQHC